MGWPLQVAALAVMAWLLTRNATPIEPGEAGADTCPGLRPLRPETGQASRSALAFSRLERTSLAYIFITRPSANLNTPPSDSDSCNQLTLVPEPSSVEGRA